MKTKPLILIMVFLFLLVTLVSADRGVNVALYTNGGRAHCKPNDVANCKNLNDNNVETHVDNGVTLIGDYGQINFTYNNTITNITIISDTYKAVTLGYNVSFYNYSANNWATPFTFKARAGQIATTYYFNATSVGGTDFTEFTTDRIRVVSLETLGGDAMMYTAEIWAYSPLDMTNVTLSNYIHYNNTNYVRTLNYIINLSCPSNDEDVNITLYINETSVESEIRACTTPYTIYSSTYTPLKDNVIFNFSIYINTSNELFGNMTFLSDIEDPNIVLNITDVTIFNASLTNISLTCTDAVSYYNITYNLTFNDNPIFFRNQTNGTLYYNDTLHYIDGTNTLIGKCTDMFGTTTETITTIAYTKILYLIDELENTAYNLDNCSTAKVYLDNNRTLFDFKLHNVTQMNYTSTEYNKLRFVIEREDQNGNTIKITKYVDGNLLGTEIRVCANKDGVQVYQQLILSATEKGAVLTNVYSNCVVAADYTRFAYQDSLLLKAYTINALYYLYTYDNGNRVYLTSLDGSISTYVNVDQLEFGATAYDLSILGDAVTFNDIGGTVKIYYINKENNNNDLALTITNMLIDEEVFALDDFDDYNEFTIYFNYNALENVTNATVFKLDLLRTTDEGESTLTRYFTLGAESGILLSSLALVLGFFFSIFGLTLAATRITLSWFGAFIMLGSLAILSFSVITWYITFLMVIDVIALIYIILIATIKNYPTLN